MNKQVHPHKPLYSIRVGRLHRALGVIDDEIVWLWIGSHDDYEMLLTDF